MAEVLDIISRLQFEANTAGLDKSIATLDKEVKSVDELTASIVRLDQLRDRTDKANLAALAKIDAALENRKNKLRQEIQLIDAKIRTDDRLRKSLAATGLEYVKMTDRIDKGANAATRSLIDFGRIIQDAPFGILGIANNINPALEGFQRLKAETGSTGTAIKALGSSLIGAGGIGIALSIVTSLLITFGDSIFDSGEKAKSATKEISEYDQAVNSVAQSIGQEISKLVELQTIASNTNLTYKERGKAVDELQEKYPDYFGNLNREMILNGQVAQTYNLLTKEIVNRGKETIRYALIAKEAEGIARAQLELDEINRPGRGSFFTDPDAARREAQNEIAVRERRIKDIQRGIDAENALGATEAFWLDQNARKQYLKSRDAGKQEALLTEEQRKELAKRDRDAESSAKKAEKLAEQKLKAYEDALLEFKKFSIENDTEFTEAMEKDLAEKSKNVSQLLGEIRKNFDKLIADSLDPQASKTAKLNRNSSALAAILEPYSPEAKEAAKKKEKAEAEIRKKNQESIIKSAKETAELLSQIASTATNRQIQLLDLELSIRTQRQQQFIELAKRGNIEILQQETERIEEIQREREKAARKQVEINAILQASNAAVAAAQALQVVTNAGATGDPYTTGVRIAAAVAALAAGFAVVANLSAAFNNNQASGFAEGGYTGDGGKYQKAGVVHKGEFVFTKEKTAQYKPVFEAIHEGKYNPYKGGFGENNKQLAGIKSAIEDMSINATNVVDQRGVRQMFITTQKIEKSKWRGW